MSTNAGGIHFIRHNSLHANCIGLKVVLASGEILDNITTLRKDNTGYDLKHLFIGAEGTLGVITECAILCPPMAKSKQLAVLSHDSFADVVEVVKKAKTELGDILQACEFMDKASMDLTLDTLKLDDLFEKRHQFYSILEVASNNDPEVVPEDSERLLEFLETVDEHITDGIVPQGDKQVQHIWDIRESVAPASFRHGFTLPYDISLPTDSFYEMVTATRNFIKESSEFTPEEKEIVKAIGYGHIGDGNLHLKVVLPGYENKALQEKLTVNAEKFIMEFVRAHRGSVSAEHGIGQQKVDYLDFSKSAAMIEYMKKIK